MRFACQQVCNWCLNMGGKIAHQEERWNFVWKNDEKNSSVFVVFVSGGESQRNGKCIESTRRDWILKYNIKHILAFPYTIVVLENTQISQFPLSLLILIQTNYLDGCKRQECLKKNEKLCVLAPIALNTWGCMLRRCQWVSVDFRPKPIYRLVMSLCYDTFSFFGRLFVLYLFIFCITSMYSFCIGSNKVKSQNAGEL